MQDSLILLISRFPKAGESKTRLIPAIGAENAANLQKEMTEFILYEAFLTKSTVQLHFSNGTNSQMQDWLYNSLYEKVKKRPFQELQSEDFYSEFTNKIQFVEQVEGDLGQKLFSACMHASQSFDEVKRKKIVIIGSDCPSIRKELLDEALYSLETHDCVIGKAQDGGYYLIAFALDTGNGQCNEEQLSDIFSDITWGSEKVFEQTMAKIHKHALSYFLLPCYSDVDFVQDIPKKISLIIPTLNEEKNLEKLFLSMPSAFNIEYIVADANSTDKTREIAQLYADKVIISEKGRAIQLQRAFEQASGEILLFLHADSLLPTSWDSSVRNILENEDCFLGYFDFALFSDFEQGFWGKIKINILEYFTNLRSHYLKLPYGDQALFVRKKDFSAWNLPIYPILEDVYLVKKAREHGKIQSTGKAIQTSFRRWQKHGFLKIICINQSVLICNALGMDLEKIKECYWQGKNPLLQYIKELFKR